MKGKVQQEKTTEVIQLERQLQNFWRIWRPRFARAERFNDEFKRLEKLREALVLLLESGLMELTSLEERLEEAHSREVRVIVPRSAR
jgi:hypothetical protein